MTQTIAPGLLRGTITPPPSKSQAHRAVIAAGLAGSQYPIDNLAASQDIIATQACMDVLLHPSPQLPLLDCGESGSTLRFLIPLALVLRGRGRFTGRGRLMERPQDPYFQLFEEKGVSYALADGVLTVEGSLTPGRYLLPGDVSSQFITGLLYALPLLPGPSVIQLTSPLESQGYVDMTLEVLDLFGISITRNQTQFYVPGGQVYRPCPLTIEADYSQSAFYYAAIGLGSDITIQGLNPDSVQGDRCIVPYHRQLCAPGQVELDVSQCPDLVPALAVHAALRKGETTRILNAARLRMKESDRLHAVTTELNRLGAQVEGGTDFLTIHGVAQLAGGTSVDAHNDHRIAMMLAVAATRCQQPIQLSGAESVAKSYPNFWADFAGLGGQIS